MEDYDAKETVVESSEAAENLESQPENASDETIGGLVDDRVSDTGQPPAEAQKTEQPPEQPPFHEHPRFKQLIEERKELKGAYEQLQNQFIQLQQSLILPKQQSDKKAEQEAQSFLESLDNDTALEKFSENPKEFLSRLLSEHTSRVEEELKSKLTSEFDSRLESRTQHETVKQQLKEYGQSNEDFFPMWQRGELQNFLKQNPGMDVITAHKLIKASSVDDRIKSEVEKAVKAKEAEMLKNFKAKRDLTVIGAGASGAPSYSNNGNELKNTNALGGLYTAITNKLIANRKTAST